MHRTGRRQFLKLSGAAVPLAGGAMIGQVQDLMGLKKRKYRVAVIGSTGRGGYGHGLDTAFVGVERAEIVALADPSTEGRQETASRLNVPASYADYRQMLQATRPDIVCIGPSWLNRRVEMIWVRLF